MCADIDFISCHLTETFDDIDLFRDSLHFFRVTVAYDGSFPLQFSVR